MAGNKVILSAFLLLVTITSRASELKFPDRAAIIAIHYHEPNTTNVLERLQTLYARRIVRAGIQFPGLSWEQEIPEAERTAIINATETFSSDKEVPPKLIQEARNLRKTPGASLSADRIFLLAALEGSVDVEELQAISQSSADDSLREQARKLALIASTKGQLYTQLSALGVPLPDLSSLAGKPVVIVFWATWSPQFQHLWPKVKHGLDDFEKKGFSIVGVNFDPDEASAQSFIQQEGITWAYFYPRGNPLRFKQDYGVRKLPSYWFVNKDGKLLETNLSFN